MTWQDVEQIEGERKCTTSTASNPSLFNLACSTTHNKVHTRAKPTCSHGDKLMPTAELITAVLAHHPHIEQAILFGSLATGKARPDSDLDLAVAGTAPLTPEESSALIADLAETLGRPVDLIDLATVGEPLLGQILRHGRRVLGSNERYARLLSKHLFDMADFAPYRSRILAERRQAWIGT